MVNSKSTLVANNQQLELAYTRSPPMRKSSSHSVDQKFARCKSSSEPTCNHIRITGLDLLTRQDGDDTTDWTEADMDDTDSIRKKQSGSSTQIINPSPRIALGYGGGDEESSIDIGDICEWNLADSNDCSVPTQRHRRYSSRDLSAISTTSSGQDSATAALAADGDRFPDFAQDSIILASGNNGANRNMKKRRSRSSRFSMSLNMGASMASLCEDSVALGGNDRNDGGGTGSSDAYIDFAQDSMRLAKCSRGGGAESSDAYIDFANDSMGLAKCSRKTMHQSCTPGPSLDNSKEPLIQKSGGRAA